MNHKFIELSKWLPELSSQLVEKLELIDDDLIKFNRSINLVSPSSILNSHEVHFFDSLVPVSHLIKLNLINSSTEVFDIGSGNGFPGLLIGLMAPEISVSLVEVDQRKCEYLKFVVSRHKLSRVRVVNQDVNTLDIHMERVICRGFRSISETVDTLDRRIPIYGRIFHIKGEDWISETSKLDRSTWNISEILSFQHPNGKKIRKLVDSQRVSHSN